MTFVHVVASVLSMACMVGDVDIWPEGTGMAVAPAGTDLVVMKGSAVAKFNANVPWPGVHIVPKSAPFDLSRCATLEVTVSNALPTIQRIWMKLRCKGRKGLANAGAVTLQPYGVGVLRHGVDNSIWRLDAPLDFGKLRGAPMGPAGRPELAAVTEIHIFRKNKESPVDGAFAVLNVTARAPAADRPILKAAEFFPFVDSFGQFRHGEWPGKVHSVAELTKARVQEESWLSENGTWPTREYDRFGGWANGPHLKATGRFRTEKVKGRWWLVNPDGRIFFSFGIAGVRTGESTRVKGREHWFEGVPEGAVSFDYAHTNVIRKYGSSAGYGRLVHKRLKAWGVNTIGNWSGFGIRGMSLTPYVSDVAVKGPPIAGAAGWSGKQFPDPFSAEFIANAKRATMAEAKRSRGDPWCIGWFVDNELPWSNDDRHLARGVLLSPASQPAKREAWRMLMRRYGTLAELNRRWNSDYGSESAFLKSTMLPDERLAGEDIDAIQRMVAREYFKVVRDAVKSADPQMLYLGCRFSNGGAVAWRAAAEYCDVVSANIYRREPFFSWPSEAQDKPLIVGEFHFGARDRGLFSPGLVCASDQRDRARCLKHYVRFAVESPRIVGAHWFKWRDQSLTGRGDGENYQLGFVDICDTPYPEMVEAARELAAGLYGSFAQ